MILETTFNGKTYTLDTKDCDRNYQDENYALWTKIAPNQAVYDIHILKDPTTKNFTLEGYVNVYDDEGDFEEDIVSECIDITFKRVK